MFADAPQFDYNPYTRLIPAKNAGVCVYRTHLPVRTVALNGKSRGREWPAALCDRFYSVLKDSPSIAQSLWAANRPEAAAPGSPPGGRVHIPAMTNPSRPGSMPG